MGTTGAEPADVDAREEATAEAREAWLDLAASDVDGGVAALAGAARRGRPLPGRKPAQTPAEEL